MKILKEIAIVAFGQLPKDEFVSPLCATLMFFIITMVTGWVIRKANNAISPPAIREHIADFSATMETCAYFFENNFIYDNFGTAWFFISMCVQCYISNRTFLGAAQSPCEQIVALFEREISVHAAMIKIGVQALAGLASYRFSRMIWALDMVPSHRQRYLETFCETDLNTTLFLGFLLEMGATLIDTWLDRQIVSKQTFIDEFIKIATGSLMVVLGLDWTGMYFNPAMASGHTYGCQGTTEWEHVFVYWAGPFVGCIAAVYLDERFHIDVTEVVQKRRRGRPKKE